MQKVCIFCRNCGYFQQILMQKERKKEKSVPFCVPLILEACVPASFLSDFRGIRSCLVPQKRNVFRNAFLLDPFLQCFEIRTLFDQNRQMIDNY